MGKLRFYIRTHFKHFSKIYGQIRNFKRNFYYFKKCGLKKVKNPDTFYFVIDPRRKHPGLADRLKAIIAAYNQAKLHGLKFKIVYKIPFALENYLLPTSDRNNWIANYDDLEYSIRDTRFVDESRDWKFHPKKGKQYHCYNYTGDISPKIFKDSGYEWSALFSELFTPCDEIRLAMAKTGLERKTYNAVHLRFVNALDNFEAGHYNNLQTEEEKLALITRCKGGGKKYHR